MSTETENNIPQEAADFKVPQEVEQTFEEKWGQKFKQQEDWVLNQSIRAWEDQLAIPDTKDNYLMPGAREQMIKQLELAKQELESIKNT